ncbi:MAG: aminoacylase [Acidimicrobiaceae bacterium]|nr:aminoacylase [Acidimicrobiaceae bacterium]|tara:strand:- start:3619 stop:5370 length:1752 start_codon:yes stop_codon:yes gene_type:complete
MATDYDVHIKNGTIVDGTRVPRFRGDMWIKDGRIARIGGRADGVAEQVIDADGAIVAPGFIDLHTHYDAQIRWDPYCSISSWHGVTSVVLGNCGFGFAPCKPDFRERSMLTMVRTEAIPLAAMQEGFLPHWDWETIPEYLDSLDRAPKGVNCLQYMPTASLMIYVMGLDAAKSRAATNAEQKEMQRLLHEGMDAGLCGFSIQRLGPNSTQADFDGTPMVTDTMVDDDIFCLAEVLAERDEGFIQLTQATSSDPNDPDDLAFKRKLAEICRRPIIDNVVPVSQRNPRTHQERLEWIQDAQEEGLRIFGQAATIRTGFAFSLDEWNLYDSSPAWREATTGTIEEKIQKMQDPALRDRIKIEQDEANTLFTQTQIAVGGPAHRLVVQGVNRREDMQQYVGKSLGAIAEQEGKHYIDVMLDLSIMTDLKTEFLGEGPEWNIDHMAGAITESPYTVPGVSDGGAHTKFFTGGAWTTDYLAWMVRETGAISLEEAHYRGSTLAAHAGGLQDRGMLREGAPADVIVYDLEELSIEPEWIGEPVYDLPGGEWRRVQHANGYRHILVNGVETFRDGECTGATPGTLLRHGRG